MAKSTSCVKCVARSVRTLITLIDGLVYYEFWSGAEVSRFLKGASVYVLVTPSYLVLHDCNVQISHLERAPGYIYIYK